MSDHDHIRKIAVTVVPNSLTLHSIRHTPEPWVVRGDGDTLCVTDSMAAYIVDRFQLGGRSSEERVANARLIAAAPRLLATVVDAVNLITWIIRDRGIRDAKYNEAQAVAKALIAAINLAVKGDSSPAEIPSSRPGDEKEIEQQAKAFCRRLGFNPEQDVLLGGKWIKCWERCAQELRKGSGETEAVDSRCLPEIVSVAIAGVPGTLLDPEIPLASEHINRAQDVQDPAVNSIQAEPLRFWANEGWGVIVLKTKPGHNQDRVVSIEYDPKDGEFIFTEQCDLCFWVSHKKADAIAALEEAIRWIKSKP